MISNSNIQIDRELCTACGACVETCIMDNLRLSLAPCRTACPLNMNCQGYVRLIARGMDQEAAEELRLQTPFASILGRICHHPCEPACERAVMDGAVHIRVLKRYLADTQIDITNRLPKIQKESGHSVAIVGSGPAGLNAAYELRCQGHTVTIFDKANQPGGLMRYGIPSFRLPSHHVDKAVELMEAMGVIFKIGKALGEQFGMTHFVNPKEVEGDLVPYLVDLTKGGADYSFECVGSVELMRQALECCHKGWGESIIIGVAGAGQEIATRPFQLVTGRVWRGTAFGGAKGRTDVPKIVDWYMEGKIDIDSLITHTMPLEQINHGFELMHAGESIRGVVLF